MLGGFSMGTVMSYALGFDGERPAPRGILAFSGFIPTVVGWEPDLAQRTGVRVFIAHGTQDQVIAGRASRARPRAGCATAGLQVDYHESEAGHHIDPREIPHAATWLRATLAAHRAPERLTPEGIRSRRRAEEESHVRRSGRVHSSPRAARSRC